MKRKTDPVQFVLVQKQTNHYDADLEQSIEAKKRVIQMLLELAFTEQRENVHLLG